MDEYLNLIEVRQIPFFPGSKKMEKAIREAGIQQESLLLCLPPRKVCVGESDKQPGRIFFYCTSSVLSSRLIFSSSMMKSLAPFQGGLLSVSGWCPKAAGSSRKMPRRRTKMQICLREKYSGDYTIQV